MPDAKAVEAEKLWQECKSAVGLANRIRLGMLYRRAVACLRRPNVCPCDAYAWLHRKGTGKCEVKT